MLSIRALLSASVPLIRKKRFRESPLVASPIFNLTLNLITPRAPAGGGAGVCARAITAKQTSSAAAPARIGIFLEMIFVIRGLGADLLNSFKRRAARA